MLVKDIMTKQVVALDSDMPIQDVYLLMQQRDIRHFPIVENEQLVGIVSDRDIRLVGSEHEVKARGVKLKDSVEKIMVYPVITAHPLDSVDEAAKVLRVNKIGAMPVVEDKKLVGMVSSVDFLDALVKMTGVYSSTSRLEVELDNHPGTLAALLLQIAEHNINVTSIMTKRSDEHTVCFTLRVATISTRLLADALRKEGFTVLWPEVEILVSDYAFIYDASLSDYELSESHPFKPVRLELTKTLLEHMGLVSEEHLVEPKAIKETELLQVHDLHYVEAVRALSRGEKIADPYSYGLGTGDNPIFPKMHEAIMRVCSATTTAVELVASGKKQKSC